MIYMYKIPMKQIKLNPKNLNELEAADGVAVWVILNL